MTNTIEEKVREGMRKTRGKYHPDVIRQMVEQYQFGDPCRGDLRLGTACGKCIRCRCAHEQMLRDYAFDNMPMDDKRSSR